jgi:hypothetical protein
MKIYYGKHFDAPYPLAGQFILKTSRTQRRNSRSLRESGHCRHNWNFVKFSRLPTLPIQLSLSNILSTL